LRVSWPTLSGVLLTTKQFDSSLPAVSNNFSSA
jgi:hypothetical protein